VLGWIREHLEDVPADDVLPACPGELLTSLVHADDHKLR